MTRRGIQGLPAFRRSGSNRGFILLFSYFVVFFIMSLMGTVLMRSGHNVQIGERMEHQGQAFQVTEGGTDHALSALRASSLQWDDELRGPDGLGGTADDGTLGIAPTNSLGAGAYTVKVLDNDDEIPPVANDPSTDVDGVILVDATGTVKESAQRIITTVWAFFNHAIAAEVDIVLAESSALGNIHANRDIQVLETSTLLGNSQATASGTFVPSPPPLIYSAGDVVGGDPRITFLRPDGAALEAAVNTWNPPTWTGTIGLSDGNIAGYRLGMNLAPNTVSLTGSATLVVFDGYSITFREKVGPTKIVAGKARCNGALSLNVIALGGGAITFEEVACLRGLIWAEGPITIAERSTITGAVVSAGSSVSVEEKSAITFDRNVLNGALLTGFWGYTILNWDNQ